MQDSLLPGDVIVLYGSWSTTLKMYDRQHGRVVITNNHYGPIHAITYLSSGYVYNKSGYSDWQRYELVRLLDVINEWTYSDVKLYRPEWRVKQIRSIWEALLLTGGSS